MGAASADEQPLNARVDLRLADRGALGSLRNHVRRVPPSSARATGTFDCDLRPATCDHSAFLLIRGGRLIFVSCEACPLRALPLFQPHTGEVLTLIESLKREQIVVKPDAPIIHEGQREGPLFTLLRGWAFRFKTLADGRRRILSFLLPGDFIGVQQDMATTAAHGVQALSEVLLCVFSRDALTKIHEQAPALAFNVTWLSAHEQSLGDDHLLFVGRRSAEERIARLFVTLFKRVKALMPAGGADGVPFPLTQQHVADSLGLTLAHTKTSLRRLEKRGLYKIEDGRLYLLDLNSLARLADLFGGGEVDSRPLI